MNIKNKKGFGLIMAIMIVTVLVIMAAGFFSITRYSTKSVKQNTESLRLYWAAESASNYNAAWWANQPDSIRKKWPNVYILESKRSKAPSEISDLEGTEVYAKGFPGAAGTTEKGILHLHPSSVYEGNAGQTNPELENHDGYKLITTRYKGPRKDFPDQAVWVLDSYAYNQETGDISNICLANVYNFMTEAELEPFIHSELINYTMAGTGFHGVKGRFNEQDIRYGPAYYGDMVHFDYTTGAVKEGPKFYGLVKSAAWVNNGIAGYDARSWAGSESARFKDASGDYYYGLGINLQGNASEKEAISQAANTLLGGYDKMAKPINTDAVTWEWDSVVEHGEDDGLYFVNPDDGFKDGNTITVELVTETDDSGSLVSSADIYANGVLKKTLDLGDAAGYYKGVAVTDNYGLVQVEGVTNEDFTLVTQTNQVQLVGDLYVSGSEQILNYITEDLSWNQAYTPSAATLASLWAMMVDPSVKAHIAVVAGLDMDLNDANKDAPIFIDKKYSGIMFTTAAFIAQYGELNCAVTGQPDFAMYNIGPVMTLQTQTKMTGSSDTAQKWRKIYIQDQRYLREDEPLPPFCGEDPGAHPNEDMEGLNRNHRWASNSYSKVDRWEQVVWRNGKPNFY